MFLLDSINELIDSINAGSSEELDKFIDETYFYAMRVIGFYPHLSRKYLPWSILQIFSYVTILLTHLYLMLINSIYFFAIDLVLFSQEVHFLLICAVSSCILIINVTHRRDFNRIHRYMAKDYFDYNEGPSEVMEQLKADVRRQKYHLLLVPLFASVNGGLIVFSSRFIDAYYGTFDFSKHDINFLLPFPCRNSHGLLDTSHGLGFVILLSGQLACITIMLPLVITGGGLILVFVLLDFIRQLKFLLHKIETAEERALLLYAKMFGGEPKRKGDDLYLDEKFIKCFCICVNKCIDHHNILLSVFENIDNFMHFNFFQCFLIGSVIIALSANCIKSNNPLPGTVLSNSSLCLNEVGYMYLLSIFGQRISDLSDEIRIKFYGLKWYNCPISFQRGILVVQEQAARTMTIMGARILPVNLNTFSSVMNSAYSYYNILNAV